MNRHNVRTIGVPVMLITAGSTLLFALRFLDEAKNYDQNMAVIMPFLYALYVISTFYALIFKENGSLSSLGLRPSPVRFWASLFLGGIAGGFFFLVYLGAYPERLHLTSEQLVRFNAYYLFIILSGELIFRAWLITVLKRVTTPGYAILLACALYALASMATIGYDSASLLIGRIDEYTILETLFRAIWNGLILGGIYHLTRSIYGNILFMMISSIPQVYSADGLAGKVNAISGYIGVGGLAVVLLLVLLATLRRTSPVVSEPASGRNG